MAGLPDMSFRAAGEYAFVNARIRGMKAQLLTVGDYERLLQSGEYGDFMKILMGTYYGPIIQKEYPQGVPHPEDLGLILARHFAEVSHSVARSLSGRVKVFVDSFMNTFLAESLKSIIRSVHVGLEKDEILRFAVPASPSEAALFERLVDIGTVDRIPDELPHTDLKLALLTRLPAYDKYDSTAPLEVALEEWALHSMLKTLESFSYEERRKISSLLELRVVLRNILTTLRALHFKLHEDILDLSLIRYTEAVNQLTESLKSRTSWREVFARFETTKFARITGRLSRIYAESEDLAQIELAVEDYIAQQVRMLMIGYPFHLAAIYGFLNLKFYEIRNIRSIAVGIERGESAETIRRMITIY